MKTITIEAMGEKRLLCNSVRVTKAISDKFGGTAGMREKLSGGNLSETLDTVLWLIAILMDGGYRYAKLNGLPCPPPPSPEELADCYDVSDLTELQQKAMEAMTASGKPDVEAEAIERKNAEAAQEEPTLRG